MSLLRDGTTPCECNSALGRAETSHSKIASHSLETCSSLFEPEQVAKKQQYLIFIRICHNFNLEIYPRDADIPAQWNSHPNNISLNHMQPERTFWTNGPAFKPTGKRGDHWWAFSSWGRKRSTLTISIITYLQKPEASKTCQKTLQKHCFFFLFQAFFWYWICNNDAPQPIRINNIQRRKMYLYQLSYSSTRRQNYVNLPTADDSPVVQLLDFGCSLDLVWIQSRLSEADVMNGKFCET